MYYLFTKNNKLEDCFSITKIYLNIKNQDYKYESFYSKSNGLTDFKNRVENYKNYIINPDENDTRLLDVVNLEYNRIQLIFKITDFSEFLRKECINFRNNRFFFSKNNYKNIRLSVNRETIILAKSSWYWPLDEPIFDYQKIMCQRNLKTPKEDYYYCFQKVIFLDNYIIITHNLSKSEFNLIELLQEQTTTYHDIQKIFLNSFGSLNNTDKYLVRKSFEKSIRKLIARNLVNPD